MQIIKKMFCYFCLQLDCSNIKQLDSCCGLLFVLFPEDKPISLDFLFFRAFLSDAAGSVWPFFFRCSLPSLSLSLSLPQMDDEMQGREKGMEVQQSSPACLPPAYWRLSSFSQRAIRCFYEVQPESILPLLRIGDKINIGYSDSYVMTLCTKISMLSFFIKEGCVVRCLILSAVHTSNLIWKESEAAASV